MVKSGKFALEVLVGGVPLAELVSESGVSYVETRFDVPGVTYKARARTPCRQHAATRGLRLR